MMLCPNRQDKQLTSYGTITEWVFRTSDDDDAYMGKVWSSTKVILYQRARLWVGVC